ncbi:hypothetical protein JB92DRAFT_2830032 [Gautieria morchelliformis]|nr:hypothetical protein JB92DRAFT_2830032 [Gautieria morchelliformis]
MVTYSETKVNVAGDGLWKMDASGTFITGRNIDNSQAKSTDCLALRGWTRSPHRLALEDFIKQQHTWVVSTMFPVFVPWETNRGVIATDETAEISPATLMHLQTRSNRDWREIVTIPVPTLEYYCVWTNVALSAGNSRPVASNMWLLEEDRGFGSRSALGSSMRMMAL